MRAGATVAVEEGPLDGGGWYNQSVTTALVPAAQHPVAVVAVDIPFAHLDRPFDYVVPADLDEQAVPGCRVRVRFAGQRVGGYLLQRVDSSEHVGRLGRLERVVSNEVVLTPQIARLCRAVADRYAGSFADVVRLAVPPRHARAEKAGADPAPLSSLPAAELEPWSRYPAGLALIERLAAGEAPRTCWSALPGVDWTEPITQAVLAILHSGRGSVVCLPDARDVTRLDATLRRYLGPGRHVVLTADAGPQARYRAFLAVARGQVQVAIGTRAAAFAPVRDLGMVAMWDDGDDLYAEPRAPYPHAREVLLLRAHDQAAAVLLGGFARSVQAQALVQSGFCADVGAAAEERRSAGARVLVAGSSEMAHARDPAAGSARLPSEAMAALRSGAADGPVLVSVARAGYRVALTCQDCREPARCAHCQGPLGQSHADAWPVCRWCGRASSPWTCPSCGGRRLRALIVGERRTAEELGKAFPGIRVRTSSAGGVVDSVDDRPQIVIATPGAEPVAADGYTAAVLLDTGLALARPDLSTAEESVRRWFNVIALVRPAARSGRVVVVGDGSSIPVQALVRADPTGFAARELAERHAARLPPAVRLATIIGPGPEVASVLDFDWPQSADVLGSVPVEHVGQEAAVRVIVRVPRRHGPALAKALRVLQATRTARKAVALRIQIDPVEIG